MSRKLIRRRKVEEKTGLSRSTIYDGMAVGTFPKSVPVGPKAVAWVEDEIDQWIEDRIAKRDDDRSAFRESLREANRARKAERDASNSPEAA